MLDGEAVLFWRMLRLPAWAWVNYNFVIIILLMLRAPKEDATLKARFGKEWESYKQIVPWMFVPYIF
jgi:protein-S-isoprenylcysteine O-methyltransferase Ste14